MLAQAPSFKDWLIRRQEIIDSNNSREPGTSSLFNERTFYRAFIKDMLEAEKEVIIYSPFVTKFRTDFFKKTISRLRERNIEVFIFTRPVEDYEPILQPQIECALKRYEEMGVCVFYMTGYIHEKVAVIDREILWEGSLNILSQRASKEIMRRISDETLAMQIISYLNLSKKLEEGYKQRYERLCQGLVINSEQVQKLKFRIFLAGVATPLIVWLCLKSVILLQFVKIAATIMKLF